jgi:hypothetical protein
MVTMRPGVRRWPGPNPVSTGQLSATTQPDEHEHQDHESERADRAGSRRDLSEPMSVKVRGLPLTRRGMIGPSRNLSMAPMASFGSAAPPLDRATSRPRFGAYR